MSNDPEQEFFSDGITEDIITDLSKASGLFVLSRNTVFSYKGKTVPIEKIARDLGVAYVVEGSVRKAGQKIRINAQLIEGATGGHIWAERYDGDLTDIFALQDEITLKIVHALKVTILPAEAKAIQETATTSVEAYTWCLRGRELLNMHNQRYYPLARTMFAKAVEIDPSFAAAYAGIADCDSYSFLTRKNPATIVSMLDNTRRAIELDPKLAAAHASRGLAYWSAGDPLAAEAEYKISLELDPNLYEANYFYGRYCRATNNLVRAVELFERAAEVRLTDHKALGLLQGVHELLGQKDAAASAGRRCVERAERELQARPENAIAAMHVAMALAALGENERVKHFLGWALSTEADDPSMLFNAACVYSRLGELDAALDLLEKVHPLMPPGDRAWTATDPDLMPLHGSPRFQALVVPPLE
jgi:adenylate cyclase